MLPRGPITVEVACLLLMCVVNISREATAPVLHRTINSRLSAEDVSCWNLHMENTEDKMNRYRITAGLDMSSLCSSFSVLHVLFPMSGLMRNTLISLLSCCAGFRHHNEEK